MKRIAPVVIVAGTVVVASVTVAASRVPQLAPAPPLAVQEAPPPRELPPLAPPRLTFTENGKTVAIAIARADVNVRLAGPLAETTLTLTFRNDNNRPLEGELNFPLPEGATISGYALDINEKLRDAVPVEKDEARVIFEQEVRKGVDPGLVEQTAGNNFRTRIYPLPAHGTRTCRIRYVSDLETDRRSLVYRVPLQWAQTVPDATIRVEVMEGDAYQPGTPGAAPRLGWGERGSLLRFARQGDTWVAERSFQNTAFDSNLSIELPDAARATLVACEPFTRASMSTPESYFVVRDVPEKPQVPAATLRMNRIGIVWDASLSRAHADLAREKRVLEQIVRTTGAQTVDVIVLRNRAEPVRSLQVGGDPSVLLRFLDGLTYDGGTNLAALRLPTTDAGAWLWFTDGLDTLGDHLPTPGAQKVPIYTISSDARSNHAYLRLIAERAGGTYLNLNRLAETEAAQAVTSPVYRLLGVDVTDGRVENVFTPGTRAARDGVLITGNLRSDAATLSLRYGIGGQVMETRTVTIRQDTLPVTGDSGLVARFWAQRRVEAASALPDQNREWLIGLGNDFGIVTPRTSLLVLERLDQYVEHHVLPPRSEPELYASYQKQATQLAQDETRQRTDKLPGLVSMWQERVRWWNQSFPDKLPALVRSRGGAGESQPRGVQAVGRAPASDWAAPPLAPAVLADTTANRALRAGVSRQEQVVSGGRSAEPSYADGAAAASTRAGYGGVAGAAQPRGQQRSRVFFANGVVASEAKAIKKVSTTDADEEDAAATVTIKPWSPDMPYLKSLKAAGASGAYAAYLRERPTYENTPGFYLDCAEHLFSVGRTDEGIRVLTGLLDLQIEDVGLLRIVAQRLNALEAKAPGSRDSAIVLFRRIADLRPEEPQPFRDLGLALADRADAEVTSAPRQAASDYTESLRLLHKVVMHRWDRFDGIEETVLVEAGRIAEHVKRLPSGAGVVNPFDPRLMRNLPCDLRVVMTWDTDSTDMDLWVTEPTGQKCYYGFNRTPVGGRLSRDFTQGYGPEEYTIRRALPGEYRIETNYFGSREQRVSGGTTLQAWVVTNWGRPSETRQPLTLRLTRENGTVKVGEVRR